MRIPVAFGAKTPLVKLAGAILVAGVTAGCGTDSTRLAESPFTNPFSSARTGPATTGASERLVPPGPKVASTPLPSPRAVRNVSPVVGSANGWTSAGGTTLTVAQGDTVNSLSDRYGVPASALIATNGLSPGAALAPGRQITIPVYNVTNAAGAAAPASAPLRPPVAAPVTAATLAPPVSARPSPKVAVAPPAAAGGRILAARPLGSAQPSAVVQPTTEVRAAAPKVAQARPVVAPKPIVASAPARAVAVSGADVARAEPAAPAADAMPTGSLPAAAPPAAPETDFRWPARGRVISSFGSKAGNGDGIAISLPEGTPVKAADAGVVAYAGSELKGYGNLVLIRHSNGFVSAYAHNGELNVKRGEQVKRGQVVARSGATGNVASPQLHFELRKGSTPVDPTKYLD